mgnify:CR=1 FL=1
MELNECLITIFIGGNLKNRPPIREGRLSEGTTGVLAMIFIIKVTTNKEERAVDMIAEKVQKKALNVFSVSRPHGLRGYVILEAEDRESAEEAVFNLPYVKGIIGKTISYEEIKGMVEPSITTVSIKEGDIVEIISEPFKKEKAKVIRIDKQKEEVVVTLLAAAVTLPVTIKLDNVKVIRREDMEEEQNAQY